MSILLLWLFDNMLRNYRFIDRHNEVNHKH